MHDGKYNNNNIFEQFGLCIVVHISARIRSIFIPQRNLDGEIKVRVTCFTPMQLSF